MDASKLYKESSQSMIHSARPTVPPVAIIIYLKLLRFSQL